MQYLVEICALIAANKRKCPFRTKY